MFSGKASAEGGADFLAVVICTFHISLQHRPNSQFRPRMSATWAQLGANSRQQGPTWIHLASIGAQLGSKLDPFHFGPSWASTWAQHENITGPKLRGCCAGHVHHRPSSSGHPVAKFQGPPRDRHRGTWVPL